MIFYFLFLGKIVGSANNRNRDLLKLPKDFMDVAVGSGRWQMLVTLMLSFITFIHLLNTGNESLMRPSGWWCKMPDFIDNWTHVQWILYSHYRDSVSLMTHQKYCWYYFWKNTSFLRSASEFVNIAFGHRKCWLMDIFKAVECTTSITKS